MVLNVIGGNFQQVHDVVRLYSLVSRQFKISYVYVDLVLFYPEEIGLISCSGKCTYSRERSKSGCLTHLVLHYMYIT